VKNVCTQNGWPKGCVTGVHLWNEPWEGISISGWQADMLRYREIYTAMANGVLDARKEGADVLQGGEGDDIFIFSSKLGSKNIDSIADFSEGDRIQLSKKIFSKAVADADDLIPLDGRNLDGNDLVVGASLAEAKSLRVGELTNAHFLFDTSNQALYYDADGLGVKEGLQFVTLTGVTSLQAEDLFIF
jgi:Ca2+-binding RTX toxin-like protein